MSYLANAGQILIEFIFGALISLIVLRVLLQWVHANFYNPICQFIYKVTNPVLMPLRHIIPNGRHFDFAGSLLAWLLTLLKLILLYAISGIKLGFLGLIVMALADLLGFVLMLYVSLILVRVILSFFRTDSYNPIVPLVLQLTEPILQPIRRKLPAHWVVDLSPMIAWLAITLARVLLVQPLLDLGLLIAKGS